MKPDRAKDMRNTQWDDLKVFLAIARAGSRVGAARAIGQTQPTMQRFEEAHIVQKRLTHISYETYASRAYLERRGLPHPSTGGVGHGLITMDSAFSHLADVGWLTGRLPEARITGRSNSRDVQARMCAAGGGLAVLPRQVGEATPGLERVDLGEPPPGRDIWVGYHRDFQRHPRLRALLDATEAALAPAPSPARRPVPPRAP